MTSSYLKFIGRYANGAATVFFVLLFVVLMAKGEPLLALFCGAVAALCGFNVYMAEKAAAVCSEEERLKAEVRKNELRRKLMAQPEHTPETVARNLGL